MQIIQTYPIISIIVISIVINFVTTLITKYMTDQKKMKELKDRQKELSKMTKEFKHDLKKIGEINGEVMQISMEMMKHSFKPLIIILIPLFLLFGWMGNTFSTIIPGKFLIFQIWIWYYLIAGIISSLILRKWLNVI